MQGSWGIDAEQRGYLAIAIDLAAGVEDPVDRAWAYRGLIDTLLRGEPVLELERVPVAILAAACSSIAPPPTPRGWVKAIH